MEFDVTVTTSADLARTWTALAAVTDYPQWTESIRTVVALDGDNQLAVGRRFQLGQPGLPPLVWQVTAVEAGHSYRWEAHSPGVRTVATHLLAPQPDGGTRITLRLAQTGPLAGLLSALTGRRTRRYVAMEAAGLRAAAEAEATGVGTAATA